MGAADSEGHTLLGDATPNGNSSSSLAASNCKSLFQGGLCRAAACSLAALAASCVAVAAVSSWPSRAQASKVVSLYSRVEVHGPPKPLPCNPRMPMGPAPSAREQPRSWFLVDATQEKCKAAIDKLSKQRFTHTNVAAAGRQWCWMGMKEFGCHRVVNQKYTWKKAQSFAALMNVTVPAGVASFEPLLHHGVCEDHSFGQSRQWSQSDWDTSLRWFMHNVEVYVLNMDAFKARWETMIKRLDKLNIQPVRVPGVDLRPSGAYQAAVDEGLIPAGFNLTQASKEAATARENMDGRILGTVGCAAAHFRAQSAAHRDSRMPSGKPLAVIFEDDVAPEHDFIPRLWSLVTEELPCDWEVLSLSSRCPYGACVSRHLSRVQPDGNEPAWRCRHGVNYGFQGVLYRAESIPSIQKLWKRTVFDSKHPHCLDVDVALASISDRVSFYAVPFVQSPGFLQEVWQGSAREVVNR